MLPWLHQQWNKINKLEDRQEVIVRNRIAPYQGRALGWVRDLPDHRDLHYTALIRILTNLPRETDLRALLPDSYDQGDLGSCQGNGTAALLQYDMAKQGIPSWTPSRLKIYYDSRAMEGTIGVDAGSMIRDGIKAVATNGYVPETEWPYIISQFAVAPPANVLTDSALHRAITYMQVGQEIAQMQACLAEGYPFEFGFSVYDSFYSDAVTKTGIVPMPGPDEHMLGGHAVVGVGYTSAHHPVAPNCCIVRNSWGPGWGDKGHFYMPWAYLESPDLADDFWTIRSIV